MAKLVVQVNIAPKGTPFTQEQWDLVKDLFRPRPRADAVEPTTRDDVELAG